MRGFPSSYLFVPATRPDRVAKAVDMDVDVIIVDLEDAVGPEEKDEARDLVSNLSLTRKIHIRINSLDTPHWQRDVERLADLDFVDALVLPMVKSPSDFAKVRRELVTDKPLLALIETPQGIQAADEIAQSGFARLLFGSADYCAVLDASPSNELFHYPRTRLVVASSIGGLPAPVDGPTTDFRDPLVLQEESMAALALGMGGKLCIHPNQLAGVREIFAPTERDKEWAREVVAEAERRSGEAFALRGQLVDKPIVERAWKILDL